MPNRILKAGLRSSERWDACTWQAQSFYVRLLTLVDDYGRYEADPVLLRSEAFPRREDIRAQQVIAWSEELEKHRLVVFYKASGKQYLALTNWTERIRSESKFPDPPAECGHLLTNDSRCSLSTPTPSLSPTGYAREPPGKEKTSSETNGIPTFEKLPLPLFPKTADHMLKACDDAIKDLRKSNDKTEVFGTTTEGTQVHRGWKYNGKVEASIRAFEKRKTEIRRALTGEK